MLLNGKTIGASGAAGSLGIKYAPKFRPARRIVPLGAPGGTSVEASLKLRQGTRVKVVEREPDAISRRAVLGGAAAACACGSLLAHDQGPLEGKTWDSPLFAEEMALGMRDYEARLRPLKCALFTGGAEGGPDFTLPTAAAAAPSATSPPPARGLVSPGCRLLEIGVGAAPNFRYYSQAALVTALEPNLAFHPKIRDSAVAAGLADRLRLVPGTAERMPFESASFDVVVGAVPRTARPMRFPASRPLSYAAHPVATGRAERLSSQRPACRPSCRRTPPPTAHFYPAPQNPTVFCARPTMIVRVGPAPSSSSQAR